MSTSPGSARRRRWTHPGWKCVAAASLSVALLGTACGSTASLDATGQRAPAAGADQTGADETEANKAEGNVTPALPAPDLIKVPVEPNTEDLSTIRDSLPNDVRNASQLWSTDWTRTTVDVTELAAGLGGSDPRDGIPPIDNPSYETVTAAGEWLTDNQPGALVRVGDGAYFYPLLMMTAHEIVNDVIEGVPVSVTYCPLCNTALAFDRRVDGQTLRFGVSGLLRRSDLVMWDSATDSLWQQVTGEAIVGEFAGTTLSPISTSIVSFRQFADGFPDGQSLAAESGRGRNSYQGNPYVGYSSENAPIGRFFTGDPDPRLPALSRVVGVTTPTNARAYPFAEVSQVGVVNDEIPAADGAVPITIFWGGNTADALDQRDISSSNPIGSAVAYVSEVDGQTLTFATAGNNASGDPLFQDNETGSTWTILGQAIDGELAGRSLNTATHRNEFWFAFAGFFEGAPIWSAG